MGRVYTCVLLLVFSHTSLPLTDWTAIAKKTGESVVRIEASGGHLHRLCHQRRRSDGTFRGRSPNQFA